MVATCKIKQINAVCTYSSCKQACDSGAVRCGYHRQLCRERNRLRKQQRRDSNKCMKCDNPRRPGKVHCESCALNMTRASKARRDRRRSLHLCVGCEQPMDKTGVLCIKCTVDTAGASADRRNKLKAAGKCTRCSKPLTSPDAGCIECAAKYRKVRESRFASGTCKYCMSPRLNGSSCCLKHALRAITDGIKLRSARKHAKERGRLAPRKFVEYLAQGHCYYCGAPPAPVNGIDRFCNQRGYIEANVCPACPGCNLAKHAQRASVFIQQSKKRASRKCQLTLLGYLEAPF